MRKILIVEDEDILRETYRIILSTEPYDITVAHDGAEALELCAENAFDLILLDLMMPRVSGLEFLEIYTKSQASLAPVILLSNLSSGDELTRALALGARKNVVKASLSPRQLLSLVRYELTPLSNEG